MMMRRVCERSLMEARDDGDEEYVHDCFPVTTIDSWSETY